MVYLFASTSKIPSQVCHIAYLDLSSYGYFVTIGRLACQLNQGSLAKIDEFQNGLTRILDRLVSHMQIEDLIVTSNIRKDVSQLGRV